MVVTFPNLYYFTSVHRKASSTSQTIAPSISRTKKAVRATLILIPLLGLQYIVMPFRPKEGETWEAVYQITAAVISSCQVIDNNALSVND